MRRFLLALLVALLPISVFGQSVLPCEGLLTEIGNAMAGAGSEQMKIQAMASKFGGAYSKCPGGNGENMCWKCKKRDGSDGSVHITTDAAGKYLMLNLGCPCQKD